MSKPAPRDPALEVMLGLQQQVNQLTSELRARRAKKGTRRGRQVAYSPGELPGPKPTELDIARAQRVWRRVR